MDWQTAIAFGIALLCGAWVLRRWLRPFFRADAACRLCDECRSRSKTDLLQIGQTDPSACLTEMSELPSRRNG